MRNIRESSQSKHVFLTGHGYIRLLSFLIPVMLMLCVCILMGITPFGNRTFLIADMGKEYLQYICYYKSVLTGQNDFSYTLGKCLGGDAFGIFVYYIMSPLLLPVYFLPAGWIPAGITLVIAAKIGLCGLNMYFYLEKRFQSPHKIPILIFSTSFAFIGFSMANTINFMWLDGVLMLPLVFYGIEWILRGNKAIRYSISLAVLLILNYYIGYMICIASVLYFVYRLLAEYPNRLKSGVSGYIRKSVFRFAGGSLLGGGLSAFVLVPIYFTLGGSLKDSKELHAGVTFPNLSPLQIFPKLFTLSYDGLEIMEGMPHIFCGFLIVALLGVFFVNKAIPRREKLLSALFLGVLIGSCCIAKLDFVWHAFMEPSGYHYRYAFIISFVMITLAYEGVCRACKVTYKGLLAYGVVLVVLYALSFAFYQPRFMTWQMAFPSMLCILITLYTFSVMNRQYCAIHGYTRPENDAENWNEKEALNCQRDYTKKQHKECQKLYLLFMVTTMLQFADLGMHATYVYMNNATGRCIDLPVYKEVLDRIGPAVAFVKEYDNGLYRMENINNWSNNDPMLFQYAGLDHYSSNEKNFVLRFLQKMGLNFTNLFVEYETGSTQTLDCLLGVRYLLATDKSINKDYKLIGERKMQVYKNPSALPLAFLADEGVRNVDMSGQDVFRLQDDMVAAILGDVEENGQNIFCEAQKKKVDVHNAKQTEKDGVTYYERTGEEESIEVSYELQVKKSGRLFFYATDNNCIQNAELYLNDEFMSSYFNYDCWKVINLGYYEEGQTVNFRIRSNSPMLVLEQTYFVTEDSGVLHRKMNAVKKDNVTIAKKKSSNYVIYTHSEKEKLLVFTVPFEKEWKVMVDGRRTAISKVYDTLLAVKLEPGEHTVEFCYSLRGVREGILISICSLLILLCTGFLKKEKSFGQS